MEKKVIGVSPMTPGVFGPGGATDDAVPEIDWCVCPKCGERKRRKEGTTCQDTMCSTCGVAMTGGLFASLKIEETENYIHVPAPGQEGKHSGHDIKTITISKPKGIKARYCVDCKKIVTYLFDKKGHDWTRAQAVEWVKEHEKEKELKVKSIVGPCRLGLVKDKNGKPFWWMLTGSAFRDLEKEIISRQALDYSIHFSDLTGFRGEADIYHIDGTEWGNCLFQYRQDKLLVEAGDFKDTIFAQKIQRWFERIASGELGSVPGASVTFYYEPEFFDTEEKVYDRVIIFKRAVLWQKDAAFPWSTAGLAVREVKDMSRKEALAEMLDDAELAESILEEAAKVSKNIEEQGVAFKDAASEEPEVVEEVQEEPEATEELVEAIEGEETTETEVKETEEEVVADSEAETKDEEPAEVEETEVVAEAEEAVEEKEVEEKGVVPFQDLPLASEDHSWDAGAARKRLATWAGGPDKDDVTWTKYRKAFLWHDTGEPENFGSYKFPIADVIDGSLKAVPAAISAAAGRLHTTDIPADDVAKMRTHLGKYYKKMDKEPPWEKEKQISDEPIMGVEAPYGGATSIAAAQAWVEAAEDEARIWKAHELFETVARNILESDIEDKIAAMDEAISEYRELLTAEKAAEEAKEAPEVEMTEEVPEAETTEVEVTEEYVPALMKALGMEERDSRLKSLEETASEAKGSFSNLIDAITQLTQQVTEVGERLDKLETEDDEKIEQKIRRLPESMFRPTTSPEREDKTAKEKAEKDKPADKSGGWDKVCGDLKPMKS